MNELLVSIEELRHKLDDIENMVRKEAKKNELNTYQKVLELESIGAVKTEYVKLCARIVTELHQCPMCMIPFDSNGDAWLCLGCMTEWYKDSGNYIG